MSIVSVASCAHHAWIASSITMCKRLADEIGNNSEWRVHTPINAEGLKMALANSDYFIMHTHGTAKGLFDYRADHSGGTIATLEEIQKFPRFPRLKMIFITACKTAERIEGDNVASALSRLIAADGLVIANRYTVWGSDYDFHARDYKRGWVGYQGGRQILTENDIPPSITSADAYRIFAQLGR